MKIPEKAHVAVVDGENFLFLRNKGDASNPQLAAIDTPDLDETNRNAGNSTEGNGDLDETAHVAAVAEWLNKQVLTNKIEDLIVVADKRSLGEIRKHYHGELEKRLVGEVGKALANHPIEDIEQAIASA